MKARIEPVTIIITVLVFAFLVVPAVKKEKAEKAEAAKTALIEKHQH